MKRNTALESAILNLNNQLKHATSDELNYYNVNKLADSMLQPSAICASNRMHEVERQRDRIDRKLRLYEDTIRQAESINREALFTK